MIIKNMNHSDIDFAYHCTTSEGWLSETREVFETFIAYDPQGCFVAEHDAQKIGICVATKYRNNGFIGELVIIPERRGQGFGSALFRHSIAYLKSAGVSNIYLDGDLDAVSIYEKSGFRKICKSLRFVGRIEGQQHPQVRKANARDLDSICKIDVSLFGDDRSFFLKRRQAISPDYCFVLDIGHQIKGYIMARPGVELITVGPWAYLPCQMNPLALLEKLASEIGNQILRIGILDTNKGAHALMCSLPGMRERVPCWRMVLGDEENLGNHQHLYAIGSAAKG